MEEIFKQNGVVSFKVFETVAINEPKNIDVALQWIVAELLKAKKHSGFRRTNQNRNSSKKRAPRNVSSNFRNVISSTSGAGIE